MEAEAIPKGWKPITNADELVALRDMGVQVHDMRDATGRLYVEPFPLTYSFAHASEIPEHWLSRGDYCIKEE